MQDPEFQTQDLPGWVRKVQSGVKGKVGHITIAGIYRGLESFWILAKIMLPVYVLVTFLRFTPVMPALADFFAPYMQFFGLPGGAALAIVVGNTVNLYAAVAVIASLKMSTAQVTILAVMLGVSHSLPMEITIVQKMKTRFLTILFLRIGTAVSMGVISKFILL